MRDQPDPCTIPIKPGNWTAFKEHPLAEFPVPEGNELESTMTALPDMPEMFTWLSCGEALVRSICWPKRMRAFANLEDEAPALNRRCPQSPWEPVVAPSLPLSPPKESSFKEVMTTGLVD